MSRLDPETKAKIDSHYDDLIRSICNQDPHASIGVVARVLAMNLATALVCIEMQHERMEVMERDIRSLRARSL